jgi:small subunit ribosomal protein S21
MNDNFSINLRKGEPVERALKRLKGKMDSEGLMEEVRRHRSFETPGQRKKRKLKSMHKKEKMARARRNSLKDQL